MVKQTYRLEYGFDAVVTVEIDHDVLTDEKLHEINSFWGGAEERLEREDGNVLNAVLVMLCIRVLSLYIEIGWGEEATINAFDWNKGRGQEGWPSMDGSEGIEILEIDPFEFDPYEVGIHREGLV